MGNIVAFAIPPKQDQLRHRRVVYTLTFIPATRQWEWSFHVTMVTRYAGTESCYIEAMRAAKLHIDLCEGVQ